VGDSLIFDFRAALEADGGSIDESAAGDMLAWLDLDGPWLPKARALYDEAARRGPDEAREGGAFVAREDVQLLAPVPRPGKIICIGLNYRDHAAESNMPIPESPVIFSKFGTSVAGPNQPVLLPPASTQVDYEAEMAVVIGRRARHVARERAYDYVLGYMNFNDVSARDFQFADKQWTRGKACDTFAPMGEYIATTDEIPDPHRLSIKLRLNGRTMQDSNTNQLIFGVPELIEFLSASITLEPGDVIATGTPPGVGFARTPPVFIKEGDVMEVEIEGLGILRNPVAAT
jgi:2-keto-4-pentenoate hydratase/2-oxohepta-3-ene-1,7-dioic acid hydratase in catechol pathway